MARQFDLVIKKGTVLTPAGAMSLDVGVRAGKSSPWAALNGRRRRRCSTPGASMSCQV